MYKRGLHLLYIFVQLKRKRIGAGFRGSSTLFQTASEFLKSPQNETSTFQEPDYKEDDQEKYQANKRTKTSTSSSSPSKTTSSNSPTKKAGKALSKKQQKLAEAAKDSHCISRYFGKKMMDSTQRSGGSEEGGSSVLAEQECNTPASASAIDMNTNSTACLDSSSMDVEEGTWNSKPVESHAVDVSPIHVSATVEEKIEDAPAVLEVQG